MQPIINTLLDPVVNFGKVTVSTGYDNTVTSVTLILDDGSKLPNPINDGSFNLVWFNNSTYSDPSDDLYVEIVRCIARVGDTLTLMRAQEGTGVTPNVTGYAHNIPTKTYKMILAPTKKTITDIQAEYQSGISTHSALNTGVHGVGVDTIDGINARNIAISTHSSITSNVHNFDASGNAPAQIHGISKHTGTIGDHQTNLTGVGIYSHTTIDTAISNLTTHIAGTGLTPVHGLGTMSMQSAGNVTITGGTITGINGLTVTSGNVGIGTANPIGTLEVFGGNAYFTNTGDTIFIQPGNNKQIGIYSGDNDTEILRINYRGYAAGITRFRDFLICDGKGGNILFVNGSTGKVGIGTMTPGQKLSVAGTVESTSGGFKFPDGSTQTTAAGGGASANLLASITPTFNGWITQPATNADLVTELAYNYNSTNGFALLDSNNCWIKYDLGSSKRIVAQLIVSLPFYTAAEIAFSDDDITYYRYGQGVSWIVKCRYIKIYAYSTSGGNRAIGPMNIRAYQI